MSTDNLPALRFGVPEIAEMAKNVSRSRLFGMDEAQTFTLMLLAQAKGLHPIQAVERYHVIQGRPALKADAMLAEFQSHGGQVKWHQHDHQRCEATFTAPNVDGPTTISWTLEDAKKADLANRDMWKKYSRQMLRSRVISEGIRMVMPGIVCGIYTPEEVSDFDEPVRRDAKVVERPETPPPPDNKTGYGRGQYASPDQVNAYMAFINDFVNSANARWLDSWESHGELPDDIGDLLRVPQATGHLLKWGLRTRQLANVEMTFDQETGRPTERVSVEKARKYVAILHARNLDGVHDELSAYYDSEAARVTAEWRAKHGVSEESADGDGSGGDAAVLEADFETSEAGARG